MRTIPLKIICTLVLLCLSQFSCNSPESISGKLKGVEENTTIYLIQPENLREVAASYLGKVIDSAKINTDGSFKFNYLPETNEPQLLELAVQPTGKAPNYLLTDDPDRANYMPVVWQKGEPLHISGNLEGFQNSFSIEQPSEINKTLLNLRDVKKEAYQTYLEGKHWEIEDGSELLEMEKAVLQYQTQLIEFANKTEFLLPALVALRWVSPENDYERVPEFLVSQCNKWKKVQPEHPWIQQLCEKSMPSNLPVLVGDVFPDLKFPMITMDTLTLRQQLGSRLTIIDLWASWCAPCRKENRGILVPLWDEYHEQGLQIVAYGLESDESAWRKAVERDGADRWLHASDLQGDDAAFLKKIRVRTIPANFILDEKGVVIAKNVHGEALIEHVKRTIEKE